MVHALSGLSDPAAGRVSVVIPHGGTDRLPYLAACLARLSLCSGVCGGVCGDAYGGMCGRIHEVIVVDPGPQPIAVGQARQWGAQYIFI